MNGRVFPTQVTSTRTRVASSTETPQHTRDLLNNKEKLRERQAEMRARQDWHSAHDTGGNSNADRGKAEETSSEQSAEKKEYNLSEAAKELKVGYKTARRLCLAHGCARYSCGAGDEVIVPGKKSKRKATETRMTWKITNEDIAGIRLMLRGAK